MKSNRRQFLKQSSLVVATSTFNINNKFSGDNLFVHHVLFWLKDKGNAKEYTNLLKSLQEFRKIKEVKFLHVGAPSVSDVEYEALATDATYTLSYLTLFENKKDKETYLNNPLHTKFFADFKDVVSKVLIYDSLHISD